MCSTWQVCGPATLAAGPIHASNAHLFLQQSVVKSTVTHSHSLTWALMSRPARLVSGTYPWQAAQGPVQRLSGASQVMRRLAGLVNRRESSQPPLYNLHNTERGAAVFNYYNTVRQRYDARTSAPCRSSGRPPATACTPQHCCCLTTGLPCSAAFSMPPRHRSSPAGPSAGQGAANLTIAALPHELLSRCLALLTFEER